MKKKQGNELIKRLALSVLAVLAAAALMTGVTAAWFTNQYKLSSIGKIHPPAYISILAPGDTVMQSIDLSYDKSEVEVDKDNNRLVVLKRPFVIRSGESNYDLCIAHTTNISGLEIKLYKADNNGEEGNADLAGITEQGKPYYWNQVGTNLFDKSLYINESSTAEGLADKKHDAHDQTFQFIDDAYHNVQKNAEPLYWVKKDCTANQRDENDRDYDASDKNYYTNYILEISWIETDKETDILYVIAQTNKR